jgi:hypothetical protein
VSLASELTRLLRQSKTERPLLAWIKRHPLVLSKTIQFAKYVAAEFPFGTDFRADFVALGPFSGGCDIHFVELEFPNDSLFTKAGVPARRLASAISQVDSWRSFIEQNRDCVVRELSKFVLYRELIFKDSEFEPMDHAGTPLYNPSLWLRWSFIIIAGRRASHTAEQLKKKASFLTHHEMDLITYDRLVDTAGRLDAARRDVPTRPSNKVRSGLQRRR